MDTLDRLAASCVLASFPGSEAPPWILDRLENGLAGVVLFAGNVGSGDDLARLTGRLHSVRADALVAIDEEGGDVTRLEASVGSSFPGNAALGAVDDVALTFDVAAAIGEMLAAAGIDLDLAPCVDVNSDARNPVIGVRSFGAHPHLVAEHGAAFVRGLQSAGVAACAKHFPGHGHTSVDSHLALPIVHADRKLLSECELVPFVAAIEAGVATIMSAHLLIPSLDDVPATLSHKVLTDLLRTSLGFEGALVTDALDMAGVSSQIGIPAAAVRALAAGADLCCLGPIPDEAAVTEVIETITAAVRKGELCEARLGEAAKRAATIQRSPTNDRTTMSTTGAAAGRLAAQRALRLLRPIPVPLRAAHVIELAPAPGIAVGVVPWGLAAPMRALDPSVTSERLGAGDQPSATLDSDRPLVVVTRDGHRHVWQRDLIGHLCAIHPDVVVVEMGWPTDAGALIAHLCTYGASRVTADAAAELLLGKEPSHG